jgi:hypothetical protein
MKAPRVLHYARLSPQREPEPCSPEQWQAWVDSAQYAPVLVRERWAGWQVDLSFTGTWLGRGTPKFFTVEVTPSSHVGSLRQFATYEQAWLAMVRVLAECWLQAETGTNRRLTGRQKLLARYRAFR